MGGGQRDHPLSLLARPWLYAISSGRGSDGLAELAAAARAGVQLLQIREKQLSTRELLAYCQALRAATKGTGSWLLLNERWDIALAAGLDGVHLPGAAVSPERVRRQTPPGFLIGVSCHAVAEVAGGAGADFAVLGPIFTTPSKAAYGPPLGLEALRAAAKQPLPVLALGGVSVNNAADCLAAGAAGVAGIRLFEDAAAVAAWRQGTGQRETA
ncbi:MAG TPA: thiamine phosphate synthase [Terriglobales bacterium]|nr:thiamine phosphate synthase [Terriglobales bacterium]